MSLDFPKKRKQKISDQIVDEVKACIVSEGLSPGDSLPAERDLMAQFCCSKGTVREALKALEVEGLVLTKPGPGGGAYLAQVGIEPASRMLRNYLYFNRLKADQIYKMRKWVEVETAASVVGKLTQDDIASLQACINSCEYPPKTEDEQRLQRIAELEFHNILADRCPNPLLRFFARFLNEFLRDMVVLKKSYQIDFYQFTRSNVDYHNQLIIAYQNEDSREIRKIMQAHMCDAECHFIALDGQISKQM